MSLNELSREDRLQLMRFVCSFAWADLDIAEEERLFVAGLIQKLDLDDSDAELVASWMSRPPAPEDVDPMDIPREHKDLFLTAVREMVKADGNIAQTEADSYSILEQLLS